MQKTILITGATDGIGLLTAEKLATAGHHVLIHGRSPAKIEAVETQLKQTSGSRIQSYCADLSDFQEMENLATAISAQQSHLDVIINNAGIYKTDSPITKDNLDIRFVVNTIAPYLLTKRLSPLMQSEGRIVNLSSAAQAPVDINALMGRQPISDQFSAYAQSKLALIMWTRHLAHLAAQNTPQMIAINPGSLLASKMVKEGFGVAGNDINIGADILIEASLGDNFADVSGQYFDNDIGAFTAPHPDGMDNEQCKVVVDTLDNLIKKY
jgi:NAD(P)-dependent dehydrogenase (short-subunit alcohol dehydrogenase family)